MTMDQEKLDSLSIEELRTLRKECGPCDRDF